MSQNFELILSAIQPKDSIVLENISYKKSHASRKEVLLEAEVVSEKLSSIGYINNVYTVNENARQFTATYSLNLKIEFLRIKYNPELLPTTVLEKLTLNVTEFYFDVPFNRVETTLNEISAYFEREGFSFTNIQLKNISQQKNALSAELDIAISSKRTIDKIVVKGYPNFPEKYLKHYLNVSTNKTFNLKSLNNLNNLVNTLPFVTQIKKPEVLFTKDSTTLYIYVQKKSNSSFDGILGFSNSESSKSIKFNGYLDLDLQNVFNKGESFNLNWQNNQKNNSKFNIGFSSPYIFNTKANAKGSFSIFKQDSSYINTTANINLGYTINHHNIIDFVFFSEKSELSSTSLNNVFIEPYSKTLYGLSYTYSVLAKNNNFRSHKFIANGSYMIGSKKSNNEKEENNIIKFNVEYLHHFNTRNALFIKTTSEILNIENPFENELFRIGGATSIRGFDELSIFTSKYNISTLEYHYFINPNSFFYTITDFSLLEDINTNNSTQLYGIGIGYFLQTSKVNYNFSYALGSQKNSDFNFNNSKFHIIIKYLF